MVTWKLGQPRSSMPAGSKVKPGPVVAAIGVLFSACAPIGGSGALAACQPGPVAAAIATAAGVTGRLQAVTSSKAVVDQVSRTRGGKEFMVGSSSSAGEGFLRDQA